MNFKRLSTLGVLSMLLFFGSCSKEQIGQTPTIEASRYSRGSISMQLNATTEAFSAANKDRAKAITFDLGTKGSLTAPKFKELTDGTKLLCIIRSSNSAQPINYIQAVWKREGNRYYIRQSDATYPFEFTAGQDLGTLYMMVVAGGEWDATTKQLKFSNRIAPITTVDGKETATLDVPFFSDWQELDIQDGTPTALKVRLKDYVKDTNETPVFTLKPQGMLIRMRVENEMLDPEDASVFRHVKLNKIYIRSTAYAGNGYYNLNENEVRNGVTATAGTRNEQLLPWSFDDTNKLKLTELTLPAPLDLPGDATSKVRGPIRKLKDYPNSPWVLVWVKSTNQTTDQPDDTDDGDFTVRTEILADVVDARSNTVNSNEPGVDAQEAAGKIVVPSMQALPAYASRILANDQEFVNGGTYSITLNLQRMPLTLDRVAEYEVAADGNAFVTDNYNNVGYFSREDINTPLGLTTGGKWRYANIGELAPVFGLSSADGLTITASDSSYPRVKLDQGGYTPYIRKGRFGIAFTTKQKDGNMEAYTIAFYPEQRSDGDKSGAYTSVIKYEYDRDVNGIPVMKMTQRYIGAYSLWAVHFPDATGTDEYRTRMGQDLKRIATLGDKFWNDPLLKKDDVVRYFPLLGYIQRDGTEAKKGEEGLIGVIAGGGSPFPDGRCLFSKTLLKHGPGLFTTRDGAKLPLRLVRPSLSFK